MNSENRTKLDERVRTAAELALAREGYVSAIDVLMGIGWLDHSHFKRWQWAAVPYLEAGIQTNLARVSEAMRLLRSWATQKGLRPSETAYLSRTPARSELRFSKSGADEIERAYRTHWVSPELSDRKRDRLERETSKPPELVVIQPHNDWTCHRCAGTGVLLIMEPPGPACMKCAGLDDLEFLPAGDAGLSRRAKAGSSRYAVVVRFARARKRYERQGLLVEPDALRSAREKTADGPTPGRPGLRFIGPRSSRRPRPE
jgi:hypothetical protein